MEQMEQQGYPWSLVHIQNQEWTCPHCAKSYALTDKAELMIRRHLTGSSEKCRVGVCRKLKMDEKWLFWSLINSAAPPPGQAPPLVGGDAAPSESIPAMAAPPTTEIMEQQRYPWSLVCIQNQKWTCPHCNKSYALTDKAELRIRRHLTGSLENCRIGVCRKLKMEEKWLFWSLINSAAPPPGQAPPLVGGAAAPSAGIPVNVQGQTRYSSSSLLAPMETQASGSRTSSDEFLHDLWIANSAEMTSLLSEIDDVVLCNSNWIDDITKKWTSLVEKRLFLKTAHEDRQAVPEVTMAEIRGLLSEVEKLLALR